MGDIFEYINNGGPIVIPILICSVVALTISIERYLSLRPDNIVPKKLSSSILHLLGKGELSAAEELINTDQSSLASICRVILQNKDKERSYITERTEEIARQETAKMERFLDGLSVIASIAPMLGLMGTVLGMVITFDSIQLHGLGDIDSLAGGISQALLTTLAGLFVGVPTLIAHRYFIAVVDAHLLSLERVAIQVIEALENSK